MTEQRKGNDRKARDITGLFLGPAWEASRSGRRATVAGSVWDGNKRGRRRRTDWGKGAAGHPHRRRRHVAYFIAEMTVEGVDCRHVRRFDGVPAPISVVIVDDAGERPILPYYDKALAADPSWIRDTLIQTADAVG